MLSFVSRNAHICIIERADYLGAIVCSDLKDDEDMLKSPQSCHGRSVVSSENIIIVQLRLKLSFTLLKLIII